MRILSLFVILIWSSCLFAFEVDPPKSVLGVSWDSTEKETIEALGPPNGYFEATKYTKFLFYGKSVVLLFERGKLKGFRYYDTCCRVLYDVPVSINQKYSKESLFFNSTELNGKTFEEVDKELQHELGNPDYRAHIATDEVSMEFGFSGMRSSDGTQEFYFNMLEIDYEL